MSFLSYLFPDVVGRFSTKYNRDIRVLEEQGKYKLLVNGSRQSGEYVKKLWQHALARFGIIPSPGVRTILVLGVAGGDVIHLLHAIYPDALITGVDIDAKMIEIGKKYFSLDRVDKLTLMQEDAQTFIQNTHEHWDIIVIDLFVGATIPPFVGEENFLSDAKRILKPKGKIIINYLYEYEYKELSELYNSKLQNLFSVVRDYKIYFNRFFYVVK